MSTPSETGSVAPPDGHDAALVGTWKLERYVDTPEGAEPIYPYGDPPVGMFIFTSDGHVSINIMRNPAISGEVINPNPAPCIPPWYCSYFGTYTHERGAGHWTTHVIGGNIPSFLGTDQPRPFEINGDTMIISGSYAAADGRTVQYERVLRRIDRDRPAMAE